MSDEGKPLTPEHIFKKVVWRSMLGLSKSLEKFTTWTITGVAAIAALLISNLDSVSPAVSASGLRWGLILLVVALLFGVVSKQIGMAVANGLKTMTAMESSLFSPDGQRVLGQMTTEPNRLIEELAEPFPWPLRNIVRTNCLKGTKDYLHGDKRFVRMFFAQLWLAWLHELFAVGALVVVALSIK